ncbi:MAG: cysteine hydrolase [Thermoleophilaceae bacterium]
MTVRPEMTEVLNAELEIDPRRTAVLAIDTHRGHLDPEIATMPVAADIAADVMAASVRLLEGTRGAGIPTAFVVMNNRIVQGESEYLRNPFWHAVESARQSLTPDLPSTISGHNLPGSPQTEVMPELAPGPDDYVVNSKHRLSSWLGTELESWLRMLKIDTLLLIGINTNTCVQCAAFEAFNRDYAAIVVSDCVHSMYGADLHQFGLENVARCFGWVLSTDEVLDKLGTSTAATAVPSTSAA